MCLAESVVGGKAAKTENARAASDSDLPSLREQSEKLEREQEVAVAKEDAAFDAQEKAERAHARACAAKKLKQKEVCDACPLLVLQGFVCLDLDCPVVPVAAMGMS